MYQFALTYGRFTQSHDNTIVILSYSGHEVELRPELIGIHSQNVFMPDLLLLQEPVPLVHLSVSTDQACKLLLHLQKVLLVLKGALLLRFLRLCHFFVKDTWCEVLSVQDSHFLLVDEDEEERLVEEEALVD